MSAVREARDYAVKKFKIKRLFLSDDLRTAAGKLFIERFGELVDLSHSGQLALTEIFMGHLQRIDRSIAGLPLRLFPVISSLGLDSQKIVAIDPTVSFGRPFIAGKGVRTATIVERLDARETPEAVAADYNLDDSEINAAILRRELRCPRLSAWRRPVCRAPRRPGSWPSRDQVAAPSRVASATMAKARALMSRGRLDGLSGCGGLLAREGMLECSKPPLLRDQTNFLLPAMKESANDQTAEATAYEDRHVGLGNNCRGQAEKKAEEQSLQPPRPGELDTADNDADAETIHEGPEEGRSLIGEGHR
jgi:uncharacterized protein (DUF433 family)